MKEKHRVEAEEIGKDSCSLLHFMQLPKNANRVKQVEALKADQAWQQSHHEEILRRVDRLIRDVEQG